MILNVKYSSEFEIDTIAHGIIKFDDLTMWRSSLIDKELVNIKKMKPDDVILVIAKNCIKRINDIIIEEPEDKIKLNEIELELSHDEIINFSTLFLEKNKYLTGEEDDRVTVKYGDGEEKPLEPDKELVDHTWPNDPIEKLKEAWVIQRKKQEAFVNKTLGLGNFKAFEGIAQFAQKQQDLISRIIKPLNMPPIVTPVHDTHIQESMRSIAESQRRIHEHRASVDAAQLAVPELLEELMELQREMYETSTELQRAANEYLDKQITQAKQDSSSAGKQSIIAIIIASLGLILSVAFGIIQINISLKPNEQLNRQIMQLDKIISQNDLSQKNIYDRYQEIINKIDQLPIENYNNKLDSLYDVLKKKNQ